MQESAQEYKQRIFGYLAEQEPLKIQSATPKKLERMISRASASKLRKQPAPGKWSVSEIVAHLADVELVVGYRIRTILGEPGSPHSSIRSGQMGAGHGLRQIGCPQIVRALHRIPQGQS